MSGVWLMTRACVRGKYSMVAGPPASFQLVGAIVVLIRLISWSSIVSLVSLRSMLSFRWGCRCESANEPVEFIDPLAPSCWPLYNPFGGVYGWTPPRGIVIEGVSDARLPVGKDSPSFGLAWGTGITRSVT